MSYLRYGYKHRWFKTGKSDLYVFSQRDTGERVSGHIIWLAKDKENKKYKVRVYANKIISKELV